MAADRSYEPFGSLPDGSLASRARREAKPVLAEMSDADEPRDDDYLRELAFQRICSAPGRLKGHNRHRRRATATPNRNAINSEPRGASRTILLKMLNGIPGF
jgi:hypothetical protein